MVNKYSGVSDKLSAYILYFCAVCDVSLINYCFLKCGTHDDLFYDTLMCVVHN